MKAPKLWSSVELLFEVWSDINGFLQLQTFLRLTTCLWSLTILAKTSLVLPHITVAVSNFDKSLVKRNNCGLITAYGRLSWLIHNYNKIWWVIHGHQSCIHRHIIDKIIKIPGAQGANYKAILYQTTNRSFWRNYVTNRLAKCQLLYTDSKRKY